MSLIVIGINHKTAPLEVRERYSFSSNDMSKHYLALKSWPEIEEALILSTCNRVELYGVGRDASMVAEGLMGFLQSVHGLDAEAFENHFYKKTDKDCAAHLFRVACGLDSMVIGEQEIVGQIKKAYEEACRNDSIGSYLHAAIQDCLRVSKKVRSLTNISRGVTSIPGAVVELIKKEPDLASKRALVIGAGKMGAMTVAKLAGLNIGSITVTNRDMGRAKELGIRAAVKAIDIRTLDREIPSADIVIAATSAPGHLLHREFIKSALDGRKKELLLIDLGVPRNVDESVRGIRGIRLYNIDDLAPFIDETMRNRIAEAGKAIDMIHLELGQFDPFGTRPAGDNGMAVLCEESYSA